MTFPAPLLEGIVVGPRRLEASLAHVGATVFLAKHAWETVALRMK